MSPRREYVDYLKDILEAIEMAEKFITSMDFDQFKADDKTRFAVIRALEIIGEASKKLPERVKQQAPGLPWREMAGIRDIVVHEYFGLNMLVIWKTLKEDLPQVKPALAELLQKILHNKGVE